MTLIDTHAHLDFEQFNADRQAVLDRALAAGVTAIVTVGTDLDSSRRAVALSTRHQMVYAAVGMHPHDAQKLEEAALSELRELGRKPKVVALGETGLDFYRDLAPRDAQRRAFQAQLALAAELGKPVIVHDREAHEQVLGILSDWAKDQSGTKLMGRLGVLHTFSGDLRMAERAIELGFFLSLSGPVTYHNARRVLDIARALPLGRLLVETDCPFLAPHPHRGQRNEPAYVRLVAEKIAAVRGLAFEELAAATTANASCLFDLNGMGSI